MNLRPFVYRFLILVAIYILTAVDDDWHFLAASALGLFLNCCFYLSLTRGSGRLYMKSIPGRLETYGLAGQIVGTISFCALATLAGSPDISIFAILKRSNSTPR